MLYEDFLRKKEEFLLSLNVSRETFDRLSKFIDHLKECNQKINLVGSSEMGNIWFRHVFDSMQLMQYINIHSKVCDFGSGSGFPGVILGILGVNGMTLVESIGKKVSFLERVSRETCVKNKVLCDRVENLRDSFDFITARAVTSLDKLLKLTKGIRREDTICVFPKGKKYQEEIEEAQKNFDFKVQVYQSITHEDGKILVLKNVR